jgi:putative Ca2+/H+ antiporter (TMEM165/GDT1 family)
MLTAFTSGLLLITVSELGDKTFFIAAVLAMSHSRRFVLMGAVAALAVMTILSVLMAQAVAFLPQRLIDYAEIALFLGFGIKLLYDASRMPLGCGLDEQKEALVAIQQAEKKLQLEKTPWTTLTKAFSLTFLAEWGDRTQITTIALAASNHPLGVTTGAILGHTICAAIAVIGGRLIAGCLSERTITAIGGVLFLIFAATAVIELV